MERIEPRDFVVISDHLIENKREYAGIQKAVKENRWMAKGTTNIDDELSVRLQGDVAVIHSRGWTKVLPKRGGRSCRAVGRIHHGT